MIGLRDFFEENEKNNPFSSGMDETRAYMRWLDMLLVSYDMMNNQEQTKENKENLRLQVIDVLRQGLELLAKRHQLTVGIDMDASEGIGITNIASHLGLRDYSFFAFLFALAPQLEERYLVIYRGLYEEEEKQTGLTFALLNRLYDLLWEEDEISPENMIRQEIENSPAFFIHHHEESDSYQYDKIILHPMIVSLCRGEVQLSDYYKEVAREGTEELLLQKRIGLNEQTEKLYNLSHIKIDSGIKKLIHITGKSGSGRRLLIHHGLQSDRILFIDIASIIQKEGQEAGRIMKSLLIRSQCLEQFVVFENVCLTDDIEQIKMMVNHAFTFTNMLFLISEDTSNINHLADRYSYVHIEIPEYKAKEREELWKYYLRNVKLGQDVNVSVLANLYRFTPGIIIRCIEQAGLLSKAGLSECVEKKHFKEVVHHFNSSKLAELATCIVPQFGWDDLEIMEEQRSVMKLACSRAALTSVVDEEWGFEEKVRYGKGMSILLYGPPGTGKTMAAQVIAGEIGLELYRVDLSQMVDKYIGETQKNIGKVFDCAREGNFILFFDEADALFTKRTEVQNSNDKHSNTEVNYLLQKMEEYDGICILATNRFSNFDDAFVRRITYTIYLHKPDVETRIQLYKSIVPAKAKVEEELDFAFFAKQFELSGSQIKAVLYNAAFIAANEGRGLKNLDIAKAIKYENTKLGKMIMASEFGPYGPYV